MPIDYNKLLEFAVQTAFTAGRLTLGYYQAGVIPDKKKDDTPVTVADRKAEELIRGYIEKQYPDHSIIGEEFGEINKNSEFKWYVDPIDGTKAFIRGVPLYAVLIGLEIAGESSVGAVYFPALDEMICAAKGTGCFWNGRVCRVSDITMLEGSFVSFTEADSFRRANREKEWRCFQQTCYHTVGWSDAYGHALVATGRVEIMLDPFLNPWDGGPFPVILREAGGYFGDWSGNETILNNEGLSTSRVLLPKVLELIERNAKVKT
ncbi:histidinol phosphate phosphatase [candidate division KSB1 bacterium]|nr:histidinol phosphate phosphatase [candidate division KSB1 bacterium]